MPERLWITFPQLSQLNGFAHRFTLRHPGIDVNAERSEVVGRLWQWHRQQVTEMGFPAESLCIAQQVHGKEVAVVDAAPEAPLEGVDGLLTATPGLMLGIYVADCCAVYLADPVAGACGLVHSGKKGSELGIAGEAVKRMQERFGTRPEDVQVQLSPCIRPPAYEVDFVSDIKRACLEAGVRPEHVHDSGICTSSDGDRFYSYRIERGRTGRMLALLGRVK